MTTLWSEVQRLAAQHSQQDPWVTHIFWSEHPDEYRLVEVTTAVESSGTAFPFVTRPKDPVILLVLLSTEEWEAVKAGRMPLPPGWDLKTLRPVYP